MCSTASPNTHLVGKSYVDECLTKKKLYDIHELSDLESTQIFHQNLHDWLATNFPGQALHKKELIDEPLFQSLPWRAKFEAVYAFKGGASAHVLLPKLLQALGCKNLHTLPKKGGRILFVGTREKDRVRAREKGGWLYSEEVLYEAAMTGVLDLEGYKVGGL